MIKDFKPGEVLSSLMVALFAWGRIKLYLEKRFNPHLIKIEKNFDGMQAELKNLADTVKKGFNDGNEKFKQIEGRLTILEQQGDINGTRNKNN